MIMARWCGSVTYWGFPAKAARPGAHANPLGALELNIGMDAAAALTRTTR